ncbi:MAG: hypothetical protein WDN44_03660 [Sphingomonas sp.]
MSNNPGRVRIAAISMIAAVPLLAGCSDDSTTVANASSASGNQQGAESKSPPAPTLPNGDLEASSLLAYLRARYDFVAKDQFSAPFDDKALIGRRFKVEIPEAEAEGDHWPITFQYDADKQLLTCRSIPRVISMATPAANLRSFRSSGKRPTSRSR